MAEARRTRRRPAELRALLLDAAERVFAERRYGDIRVDDIAAEAGVTRSVMYRHFDNKTDLFREAVLAPFVESLTEYTAAWSAQVDEPWDEVRLTRTMVSTFHHTFAEHRGAVLALAGSDADPDVMAIVDEALAGFFAEMLRIGRQEQLLRGWFAADGLELTIRLVLGAVAAATVLERLFLPAGQQRPSDEEVIDRLTALTLYGLRLQAPPGAAGQAPHDP